jgi:predicted RND superfamily exporter protein
MVQTFGGTSAVLVAMEVKEGEIFEPKNLDKLNRIQTAIKNMRGVGRRVKWPSHSSFIVLTFPRISSGLRLLPSPDDKSSGLSNKAW